MFVPRDPDAATASYAPPGVSGTVEASFEVGGSRARPVLSGEAAVRDATVRFESENAPPIEGINARLTLKVLTIMVVGEFAAGALAPAYAAPYRTPTGQLVLAVFSAVFIGILLAARQLALPRRPARILSLDSGGGS